MLGEQIKSLRMARNISQVTLANQLGVTKQSISNWENNNILPSIEMLVKISRFFSLTSNYWLMILKRLILKKQNLNNRQSNFL